MAGVDCQDTNATTHGLSNRTGENNCFINSVIQVSLVYKDVGLIFVLVVPIIVLATMRGELLEGHSLTNPTRVYQCHYYYYYFVLIYYHPGTLASRHFQRSFRTDTRTCVSRAGVCVLYSQGIESVILCM